MPWITRSRRTLLSIGAVLILVFSVCALLKVNGDGGQVPPKELFTGSIPKAAAVRSSASNDPIVAFLSPASTQLTAKPTESTLTDRRAVPLPRPRPQRVSLTGARVRDVVPRRDHGGVRLRRAAQGNNVSKLRAAIELKDRGEEPLTRP